MSILKRVQVQVEKWCYIDRRRMASSLGVVPQILKTCGHALCPKVLRELPIAPALLATNLDAFPYNAVVINNHRKN